MGDDEPTAAAFAAALRAEILAPTTVDERHALAEAARAVGEEDALRAHVLAHAGDPDPATRLAVARALPLLEGAETPLHRPATIAALVGLAHDVDDEVRSWALFALGRGGVSGPLDLPDVRAAFRANLDHANAEVQMEATEALALLGDVEAMVAMLDYEEPGIDVLEKAAEMAEPRLHAALVDLREYAVEAWTSEHDLRRLDRAIVACAPPASGERPG